jgi:UDP-N-acetylmuramoylalanine--D-glutamate ligase
LRADVATVLNISQDHLDWHGGMSDYVKSKERIFGPETIRVLNRDDARVMKMIVRDAPCNTFGVDAPKESDAFGLVEEHGMRWLVQAISTDDEGEKKKRGKQKEPAEIFINRLMPADALKIRGLHNASNVLAALALCRSIDLPLAPLLHAARQYQGEPHRVESIATIRGVDYIDDSKGTNVGAAIAALNGLGSNTKSNLILIAGGDGKGQDFAPLAKPVTRYVRAVMLIGKDGPAIRAALADTGIDLIDCWTLEQAVERAAEIAVEGDVVLLSPACASFDMFTNYAHRAQVFGDAVRELGLSHGEISA